MNQLQLIIVLGLFVGLGLLILRAMNRREARRHAERVRVGSVLPEDEVKRIADLLFAALADVIGEQQSWVDIKIPLDELSDLSEVDRRRIVKSLVDRGRVRVVNNKGEILARNPNWTLEFMPRYLQPTTMGWEELKSIRKAPHQPRSKIDKSRKTARVQTVVATPC